jgi:hypothetical protein
MKQCLICGEIIRKSFDYCDGCFPTKISELQETCEDKVKGPSGSGRQLEGPRQVYLRRVHDLLLINIE